MFRVEKKRTDMTRMMKDQNLVQIFRMIRHPQNDIKKKLYPGVGGTGLTTPIVIMGTVKTIMMEVTIQ